MTTCNFCNKRESRSCLFNQAYLCNDCYNNEDNHGQNGEEIIFVDSNKKNVSITSDTNLEIIMEQHTGVANSDENTAINNIDTNNFKDASLYLQVEFLKKKIYEKDLLF